MEFDKVISDRYSVRKFKAQNLTDSDVKAILKAGHIAPTGCNYQPQRILVLNNKNSIEKLRSCTRCHFNAPTAMLICYNVNESWVRPYDKELSAPVDAVIVATHMMLKAQDIGVGCCWVMHFNPTTIKQTFNVPENFKPVALLVMGYPSDDATPLDLHYKKKGMDEVIFYDTF